MQRIDLDYWYTMGRAMALLEATFGLVPCHLDARGLSRVDTALGWLKPLADGGYRVIPGMQRVAADLVQTLTPITEQSKGKLLPLVGVRVVDERTQAAVNHSLTAFHNVLRSGAQEIYVFHINARGAYSVNALLENAETHLSTAAQQSISDSEKRDFALAGACYTCDFWTATGFHAMRATEAEARRYHMVVTGAAGEVDWTLDPLINGNSGRSQFGLRDQWKKEGARFDSPLSLIISLLSSVSHIYRNPIMHPEMTLNQDLAKQVFDTAALAISAMVEDRIKRQPPTLNP